MHNKILLTFTALNQALLYSFAMTVCQRMSDDPQFASFRTDVDLLKAETEALSVAIANANRGSQAQTAAKNDAMSVVVKRLKRLVYLLNGIEDLSDATIKTAGFDPRTDASTVKEFKTPTNLAVVDLREEVGAVKFTWSGCAAATNYGIETQIDGETTWQNGVYASAQSAVIRGLASGKYYWLRVCTLSTRERKSAYSEPIKVLVS